MARRGSLVRLGAKVSAVGAKVVTALPLLLVALVLLSALVPQLLAQYPPDKVDTNAIFQPSSAAHWLGTDQLGRDVFSRIVYGTRESVLIGVGATLLAITGGILLATATGLAPSALSRLLKRCIDVMLAFPELLIALLVIAVVGRGPLNTLLAVGVAAIAGYARLVYSQVLGVKRSEYVAQAVALGESPARIILTHIVPNTVRPLLTVASLGVGTCILSASALSFLGLGVVPPAPEWGALLADGRNYLGVAPWISLYPATVVALCVLAITLSTRRLQKVFER